MSTYSRQHSAAMAADQRSPVQLGESCLPSKVCSPSALRQYFADQGADLDRLLDTAARHFESDQIVRRTDPLTDVELEGLIEGDERM